jgi:hypothetical protein
MPPSVEPVAPPDAAEGQAEEAAASAEAVAADSGSEEVAEAAPAADAAPSDDVGPEPADEVTESEAAPEPADAGTAEGTEPAEEIEPARPMTLEDAVEAGDDQNILRELYKEVTAIAEGIWTKEIPPPARVWERVSVSDWYEKSFSALGLRPLSDFYGIISKVDRRMRDGASKEDLQEFLKESNFAQTLLALRDMFQKNDI